MTESKRVFRGVAIGAGYFSQYHYDAWQRLPTAELRALCDIDEDRAGTVARRYGVPRAYSDFVDMLDKEQPDFVDVITPPATHADICTAAAARGIPVICQKPLAPGFSAAQALVVDSLERVHLLRLVG